MIRVEILQPTRAALRPFVRLPFAIYKNDPNWVPPLKTDQLNTLVAMDQADLRFFLVYHDDKPVARVMAGIDRRLNERIEKKYGFLSMFESENNIDYAKAALDAAAAYLKQEGMDTLMGPYSPTVDDFSKGLLVEGFDGPPVLFNPYNPPYYAEFFEKCGFVKHRDHFAYLLKMEEFDTARVSEIIPRAKKRFGFRVEHINITKENEKRVIANIARVLGEAFPTEWELNVPTYDDIAREFEFIKRFYRPEMAVMAFAGNRPIGLVIAFPDYNQLLRKLRGREFPFGWPIYYMRRNKIDGVRCNMQFVVPEYQNMAVNTAMLYEAYLGAQKLGIKWVEGSTVDETNAASINNTEKLGGKKYRTYRQYHKVL